MSHHDRGMALSRKKYRSNLCNNSIAFKLRNREIFGKCHRSHRTRTMINRGHIFHRIPRRLAFQMTAIIERQALLEDGHVFLGFSSCNRFLLSYTEEEVLANHSGFISHVYKLHWWMFDIGVKAKKIASVRLFANEEIEFSLFLCYAEWPTMKSQVVVYGFHNAAESCYITIAAVPSIVSCKQCEMIEEESALRNSAEESGHSRCIRHGFSLHLKQAVGSSRGSVLNSCGLKIDAMLVLNIGHSIAVISSGVLDESSDLEQLPLSSIKRAGCEESVTDSELARILRNDEQQEEVRREIAASVLETKANGAFDRISWNAVTPVEAKGHLNLKCHCSSELPLYLPYLSSSSVPNLSSPYSSKKMKSSVYDIGNCDEIMSITLVEKSQLSEDKENITKEKNCAIPAQLDPYYDPEPKSIKLGRTLDSEVQPKFDEYDFDNNSFNGEIKARCSTHSSSAPQMKNIYPKRMLPWIALSNHMKRNSSPSGCQTNMHQFSGRLHCAKAQNGLLPQSPMSQVESDISDACVSTESDDYTKSHFTSSRSPCPAKSNIVNSNPKILQSPKEASRSMVASPSVSEGSGSMFCSAESHLSQGFANSVNNGSISDGLVSFSENFYGTSSHFDVVQDDSSVSGGSGLFYCSMLCQGSGGEILHPVSKSKEMFHAFSQHLVLDLEHVIFDILRTRCYNAYKYGHLVDYESNITDVCSDTKSVVVHITALLNIVPHGTKPSCVISSGSKTVGKLQQAEFILCWRLHTGRYEVVVSRPLKEYDEVGSGKWKADWIVKTDNEIRRQCLIHTDVHKSVYVLDNAAVCKRRSLNVLWNCDKTFLITR